MSTNQSHNVIENPASAQTNGHHHANGEINGNGSTAHDFDKLTRDMTHEEKTAAQHAARFGYGPLAHMRTNDSATLPGKKCTSLKT